MCTENTTRASRRHKHIIIYSSKLEQYIMWITRQILPSKMLTKFEDPAVAGQATTAICSHIFIRIARENGCRNIQPIGSY